jgi:HSP20 family molecular chaperone IbpA
MNHLFRNGSLFDNFFGVTNPKVSLLKTDLLESGDDYVLKIEVAGYDKEQVKLSVEDSYLTVSVTAKESNVTEDQKYLRREISNVDTSREFYVGDVTTGEVKANIADGILTITVPKTPKAAEKKFINIE